MKWLDDMFKECVPEDVENTGHDKNDVDIEKVAKKVVELLSKGGENDVEESETEIETEHETEIETEHETENEDV